MAAPIQRRPVYEVDAMRTSWLVVKHDLGVALRQRSFWFFTLLVPALLLAVTIKGKFDIPQKLWLGGFLGAVGIGALTWVRFGPDFGVVAGFFGMFILGFTGRWFAAAATAVAAARKLMAKHRVVEVHVEGESAATFMTPEDLEELAEQCPQSESSSSVSGGGGGGEDPNSGGGGGGGTPAPTFC